MQYAASIMGVVLRSVYYPSGTYLCQRKDMGQVITANISSQFASTILRTSGVSATLQYRASVDGTIWTVWADFEPIMATFRYLDFRINLKTDDGSKTPEVTIFQELVDVPDTDRYGTATIPIGGGDVAYGHIYYRNPVFTPTAIGPGLRAELASVGLSSARVKILDALEIDVGGTINWTAKGY